VIAGTQKAAVEHFACQDGKVGLTVHCEDTFGNEHTILHRFWTNAKCVSFETSHALDYRNP
jgi:hypothetical protein